MFTTCIAKQSDVKTSTDRYVDHINVNKVKCVFL